MLLLKSVKLFESIEISHQSGAEHKAINFNNIADIPVFHIVIAFLSDIASIFK